MSVKYPKIYGMNATSEAGDDTFATSIFLQGCNVACPYCMNSALVNHKIAQEIPLADIKSAILNAKCKKIHISGGEPLIDAHIIELINEIRNWGCSIGISTNGMLPETLKDVIPLVDFVTLDMKCGEVDYNELCDDGWAKIQQSYQLLLQSNVKYDIRTTLYPPFIHADSIIEIGEILDSNENWIFQPFRVVKNPLKEEAKGVVPYTKDETDSLKEVALTFVSSVSIKNV